MKNNNTKVRIIVRFKGLEKSRIAISILDFLSPLKQTIIHSFLVLLVFINGIIFLQTQVEQGTALSLQSLLLD
ncbi:MAG: hypothetical protein FE834_06370 [Gammaproteobacteria bacterium]|nr:hypothetical protein [Gammaproteobacteria bacterium]